MSARRLFAGWMSGVPRLRISRAGTDAKTAADSAADIVFDSAWAATLPIHDVKTITTPGSAVSNFDVTWADLGYIPLVQYIFDRNSTYLNGLSGGFYTSSDIYRENVGSGLAQHICRIYSDRANFRKIGAGNFGTSLGGGILIVFRYPSGAS